MKMGDQVMVKLMELPSGLGAMVVLPLMGLLKGEVRPLVMTISMTSSRLRKRNVVSGTLLSAWATAEKVGCLAASATATPTPSSVHDYLP